MLNDKTRCVPNVCKCENGDEALEEECPKHEQDRCSVCNDGYMLMPDFSCKEALCNCPNGIAKSLWDIGWKFTAKQNRSAVWIHSPNGLVLVEILSRPHFRKFSSHLYRFYRILQYE